jgi:metallo-beta-lactamase class B
MSVRLVLAALAALTFLGAAASKPVPGGEWATQCDDNDEWDKPGPPFRIHGNTYYVGTCGIAAILVTSPKGHVLIDSGTEAGAKVVAANIEKLGFRLADVKAMLMSHEHFDHVGGMAWLQAQSGAALVTSEAAAAVMRSGRPGPGDPQAALLPAMAPVGKVERAMPGGFAYAGRTVFWPVPSPGHTPGAMSWTWRSCEGRTCRWIVYADSLNPISAKGYRFSDHPEYVAAFRNALDKVAARKCDILITPHPGSSDMRARLQGKGLRDTSACKRFAATMRQRLDARLAEEQAAQ